MYINILFKFFLGLKIILDIVPNHSSDQHEWFQWSARKIEPYTNYYIWTNGSIDKYDKNIPPNNWVHFSSFCYCFLKIQFLKIIFIKINNYKLFYIELYAKFQRKKREIMS